VNPSIDGSYLAGAPPAKDERYFKFARGGFANEIEGKPVWFQLPGGELRPAWIFNVPDENGVDRYATIIDSVTQRVLFKYNSTLYQQPQPQARGLVFERESPQPNPTPGATTGPRSYVERTLQPFTGDPVASPRGWVDGTQTVGNNVHAGHNPLGQPQILNPQPAVAADRNFSFPLQLGPEAPNPANYKDAATTNLFYWANKAHDLFYNVGFNEAAGNYQRENFGRGGIGGDPIVASSQFGIARNAIAAMDNAFYSTNRQFEDGARATINMYLAGSRDDRIFTDGSFDAQVIVHEYAHGVTARLVEDVYTNLQGRAMGEGWSDYFGLEFTLPESAPAAGQYPIGEYFDQSWGLGIRTRPYSTDMRVNPLTFTQYGRFSGFGPEEHFDGEIWMSVLWDARANLIEQLGPREGRRRMSTLVIDGMKLAPPAPSMVDARDAILLADRVGFRGESQRQLWAAFSRRGLGTTAFAVDANSVNVTSAFNAPSSSATLQLDQSQYGFYDLIRVILHDANNTSDSAQIQLTTSSGDLENLVVRKKGDVFYGTAWTGGDGYQDKFDSWLDIIPGDTISAYYVDADTGSGPKQFETNASVMPDYGVSGRPGAHFISGRETPVFTAPQARALLGFARVSLPFEFPFLGRKYRTVYVAGNGILTFDAPPLPSACNDPDSVSRMIAIAPMYMEMVYGGRGQSGENVYISADSGSFTVRWVAETTHTGEPINVSAVLFSDGRILFQYGRGNNNLVNTGVTGCSSTAPFVGLSKGNQAYLFPVEYSGSPNLDEAPSLVLDAPFSYSSLPVVRIETPTANGRYQGVLTVRGVAYDQNDFVDRLDILIDGNPRRLIRVDQQRPDVCNAERLPGCPFVGFQTTIDFAALNLPPGEHTLQIRATNTRGAIVNAPEQPIRFTIEAGQSRLPVGRIEAPADGAELTGANNMIRGWAYAPDLRIAAVDVLIDGLTYGQAQYGARRDDVCGAITDVRPPNCPNVGFTFTLNTSGGRIQLPNGTHLLQVRARDEAGRYTLIPETPMQIVVSNESNQPPTGVLLNPASNQRLSGTVKIWGWAWDPDGTVDRVDLLIDGFSVMRLNYGDERAEQCAAMPVAPAACPNIGFWGDFDTGRFPNGLHSLGVRITDNQGRITIIPRLGNEGMNVYFEN
jgi:hypothetical protein